MTNFKTAPFFNKSSVVFFFSIYKVYKSCTDVYSLIPHLQGHCAPNTIISLQLNWGSMDWISRLPGRWKTGCCQDGSFSGWANGLIVFLNFNKSTFSDLGHDNTVLASRLRPER